MRTILLLGCSRTEYIQQVAESILIANHKNYLVTAWIDWSEKQAEVFSEIKRCLPNATILKSPTNQGQFYLRTALEVAFSLNEEVVVVEDDIILSPDAIDLAGWFFDSKLDVLALNLFNHSRGWEPADVIAQSRHFCPWGWAINSEKYQSLKPCLDLKGHWDTNFNTAMKKNDWRTVCPLLSRSLHAGRTGDHQNPNEWDRVYGKHVRSDGQCRDYKFRVTIPEGHLGVEPL
jgi:hypothetical protein